MKHQQVVVDYWAMLKMSGTCLMLALSGYVLIKMIQTIFWLPGYLEKNQKRLEKMAEQYSVEVDKEKQSQSTLDNTITGNDEQELKPEINLKTCPSEVVDGSDDNVVVADNDSDENKKDK